MLGCVYLAAGLALAGLPPFAIGLGKIIGEDGLSASGFGWGPVLFIVVSALSGGAVLRAGARIFLGIGRIPAHVEGEEMSGDEEKRELPNRMARVPVTMAIPLVGLLAAGAAVGLIPAFGAAVAVAAERFIDHAGYVAAVLGGSPGYAHVETLAVGWSGAGILLCLVSVAGALLVATTGLYAQNLPRVVKAAVHPLRGIVHGLHRIHSGHIGDYVVWLLIGVGGAVALAIVP
ncbi:hypothetical protein [Rathayibacter soli]|uniref:hypothetical protein n=1 Tax=Rathayibacter soli TaxID=3144168 RepID=UPI0027E4FF80|nr:hypothetical protein [Glaciibacter superstes]